MTPGAWIEAEFSGAGLVMLCCTEPPTRWSRYGRMGLSRCSLGFLPLALDVSMITRAVQALAAFLVSLRKSVYSTLGKPQPQKIKQSPRHLTLSSILHYHINDICRACFLQPVLRPLVCGACYTTRVCYLLLELETGLLTTSCIILARSNLVLDLSTLLHS